MRPEKEAQRDWCYWQMGRFEELGVGGGGGAQSSD